MVVWTRQHCSTLSIGVFLLSGLSSAHWNPQVTEDWSVLTFQRAPKSLRLKPKVDSRTSAGCPSFRLGRVGWTPPLATLLGMGSLQLLLPEHFLPQVSFCPRSQSSHNLFLASLQVVDTLCGSIITPLSRDASFVFLILFCVCVCCRRVVHATKNKSTNATHLINSHKSTMIRLLVLALHTGMALEALLAKEPWAIA